MPTASSTSRPRTRPPASKKIVIKTQRSQRGGDQAHGARRRGARGRQEIPRARGLRNKDDGLIHTVEKSLRGLATRLAGRERPVESAVSDLRTALRGEDKGPSTRRPRHWPRLPPGSPSARRGRKRRRRRPRCRAGASSTAGGDNVDAGELQGTRRTVSATEAEIKRPSGAWR
jgi:hypothetical protein